MGIVNLSLETVTVVRKCSNCGLGLIGMEFCPEHQNSEPDVSRTVSTHNWEFDLPNEQGLKDRWWIRKGSMGSAFEPPGRAVHYFELYHRDIHCGAGSMSLDYPLKDERTASYVPESVKTAVRQLLTDLPGDAKDEKWIRECYSHWRNCFSVNGKLGGGEHMFWNKNPESLFGGEYAWYGMVPVSDGSGGPETWQYIKADILNRHTFETHDDRFKKVMTAPPDEWRTAVLWIRQYDPEHQVREDLI